MGKGIDRDRLQQLRAEQVAVADGLKQQASKAGQDEHVLDHDGADQQTCQLYAKDGDDRNRGKAEPMTP